MKDVLGDRNLNMGLDTEVLSCLCQNASPVKKRKRVRNGTES